MIDEVRLAELKYGVIEAERNLDEARKIYDKAQPEKREERRVQLMTDMLTIARGRLRRAEEVVAAEVAKVRAAEEASHQRAPPSLQDLVLAHAVYDADGKQIGGYERITPEAWAKFDDEMRAWKAKVRYGEFPPLTK